MRTWYKITTPPAGDPAAVAAAAEENRATILIYDEIGEDFWGDGFSAKQFFKDLHALEVADIDVHINSPGGNVFDGNSIYNVLRGHPAKIHVTVDGIAASIASVIAMAGDDVAMPQNAMLMIHDPSGLVIGTADDMRKLADALDKVRVGMIAAYQSHAELTDEELIQMLRAETWLTAEEAVAHGFADEVTERINFQANFKALDRFSNLPECLRPPASPAPPAPAWFKNIHNRRRLDLHLRQQPTGGHTP